MTKRLNGNAKWIALGFTALIISCSAVHQHTEAVGRLAALEKDRVICVDVMNVLHGELKDLSDRLTDQGKILANILGKLEKN